MFDNIFYLVLFFIDVIEREIVFICFFYSEGFFLWRFVCIFVFFDYFYFNVIKINDIIFYFGFSREIVFISFFYNESFFWWRLICFFVFVVNFNFYIINIIFFYVYSSFYRFFFFFCDIVIVIIFFCICISFCGFGWVNNILIFWIWIFSVF